MASRNRPDRFGRLAAGFAMTNIESEIELNFLKMFTDINWANGFHVIANPPFLMESEAIRSFAHRRWLEICES